MSVHVSVKEGFGAFDIVGKIEEELGDVEKDSSGIKIKVDGNKIRICLPNNVSPIDVKAKISEIPGVASCI